MSISSGINSAKTLRLHIGTVYKPVLNKDDSQSNKLIKSSDKTNLIQGAKHRKQLCLHTHPPLFVFLHLMYLSVLWHQLAHKLPLSPSGFQSSLLDFISLLGSPVSYCLLTNKRTLSNIKAIQFRNSSVPKQKHTNNKALNKTADLHRNQLILPVSPRFQYRGLFQRITLGGNIMQLHICREWKCLKT